MPIASRNPITLYFHSTVAGKETEDTGIGRIRCAVYYEIDLVFPFPNCNPEPWTCSVLSSSSLSRGESSCRWRFRFCRRWFLIIFSLLLFFFPLFIFTLSYKVIVFLLSNSRINVVEVLLCCFGQVLWCDILFLVRLFRLNFASCSFLFNPPNTVTGGLLSRTIYANEEC